MNQADKTNESAISYAWLIHKLGLNNESSDLVTKAWKDMRTQMLARTPQVTYTQDWISDFWLSRNADNSSGMMLLPTWNPPEQIDEWLEFGTNTLAAASGLTAHTSNNNILQDLLLSASYAEYNNYAAVDRFMGLTAGIQQQGDNNMKQNEHVRAWIATAIGHLLMGITLSPENETHDPVKLTTIRLQLPLEMPLPGSWTNEFEERRIEWLYNKRMTTAGRIVSDNITIRVGQGEEWREHWGWLSADLSSAETIEAVQLAACLFRCTTLVKGLLNSLASDDDYLRTMALVVIRRLLLTLKTMTWLEEALTQTWAYNRQQDLSCFAFNAMKPDWPHRIFSLSHRSADVKASLITTNMWRSWRCAIDARYVPSWETNTGMMWGLFASAPVITRIYSDTYLESLWCLRENEITEYLYKHSDFLRERLIVDIDASQIALLDKVITGSTGVNKEPTESILSDFPPLCMVWMAPVMTAQEIKIMRASAALRLMRQEISDNALTNTVALIIEKDIKIPQPAPTNNPDGWLTYTNVFRDLAAICNVDANGLPVRLREEIDPEELWQESELSQRVPNLSDGIYALKDVLAAYEWLLIEWPLMLNENRGNLLIIDCRDITEQQWITEERLSILRGIASLRTPGPLWFIQRAGQFVENWPLVGERPIFTEHVEGQFSWMMTISLDRPEMLAQYPENSGLNLSPQLIEICKAGQSS